MSALLLQFPNSGVYRSNKINERTSIGAHDDPKGRERVS